MHAQMYAHTHRCAHTRAQRYVQIHICVLAHVRRGVCTNYIHVCSHHIHMCSHVCRGARAHYIHVCSHMCTHIHKRVLACMHTEVCAHITYTCAHTCAEVCVHMHTRARTCIYIHVRSHTCPKSCVNTLYIHVLAYVHTEVCAYTHAHAHGGPGSCKEGTGGRSGGPAVRRTQKGVTSGDTSFPKKKFKNAWEESRKEEPDVLRAPGAIGAAVSLHTLTTVRGGDTASLSQCKAAKSRAI